MKENKQYYFFNTIDLPFQKEKQENSKTRIIIKTKTGIVLFDSDDYKEEGLIVEMS